MKTTFFDGLVSDFGIWEHSDGQKPLKGEGYALDDAARALILCVLMKRREQAAVMFDYVKNSFRDGTLYGQANEKGEFFDAPAQQDPTGQTVWGLAVAWQHNFRPHEARELVEKTKQILGMPQYLRSVAYALLGAMYIDPEWAAQLADNLVGRFAGCGDDWPWPEDSMTYAVGIPPYALLRYARMNAHEEAGKQGLRVLKFIDEACRADGRVLGPIGNNGWFPRGGRPAAFDQQPIDVTYMHWAMMAAYELTHDMTYYDKAQEWMEWYEGKNPAGKLAYDPETNKCYDGINNHDHEKYGIKEEVYFNPHSGAESNICFLLTRWVQEHKQTF